MGCMHIVIEWCAGGHGGCHHQASLLPTTSAAGCCNPLHLVWASEVEDRAWTRKRVQTPSGDEH